MLWFCVAGEEFAVGCINKTRQEIVKMGNEFVKEVEREMAQVGSYEVALTVSIGVAYYSNTPNLKSDDIFKTADLALYNAKDNGRNNAKFVYKD